MPVLNRRLPVPAPRWQCVPRGVNDPGPYFSFRFVQLALELMYFPSMFLFTIHYVCKNVSQSTY